MSSKGQTYASTWEQKVEKVIAGESHISSTGYRRLYCPMHPSATSVGHVYEHRVVLEAKLGRFLAPGEVAHHINAVRDDNRPENLKPLPSGEHARLHNTGIPDAAVVEMLKVGYTYSRLQDLGVARNRVTRLRRELGVQGGHPNHIDQAWAAA